jgi:hypothetical protein
LVYFGYCFNTPDLWLVAEVQEEGVAMDPQLLMEFLAFGLASIWFLIAICIGILWFVAKGAGTNS